MGRREENLQQSEWAKLSIVISINRCMKLLANKIGECSSKLAILDCTHFWRVFFNFAELTFFCVPSIFFVILVNGQRIWLLFEMVMKLSAKYRLATLAFESSTTQNDMFGANGLPLTPPSITMVGNFHSFVQSFNTATTLTPYLTHYLDCIRSKNGMSFPFFKFNLIV